MDITGTNGSGAIGPTTSENESPAAYGEVGHDSQQLLGIWCSERLRQRNLLHVGNGQVLVHQYLTPTGDIYWVNVKNAPTLFLRLVRRG